MLLPMFRCRRNFSVLPELVTEFADADVKIVYFRYLW